MKNILLLSFLIIISSNLFSKILKLESIEKNIISQDGKVLSTEYVTAPSGLAYRSKPSLTAKKLGAFRYYQKIDIIQYTGIWLQVEDEGKTIEGEWVGVKLGKQKVYVFDGFLADSLELSERFSQDEYPYYLNPASLYKGEVSLMANDSTFLGTRPLEGFVSIEIITKDFFESKRSSAQTYADKPEDVIKTDSSMIVICQGEKFIEFKEHNGEEDSWDELHYFYEASIERLNAVMIYEAGYEWGEYFLVNKASCESIASFNGYPFFLQGDKTVVTVCSDCSYDEDIGYMTDIMIYKDENRTFNLKTVINLSYNLSPEDLFFSKDGYLYLESSHHWNDGDGSGSQNYSQYFRFKILKY